MAEIKKHSNGDIYISEETKFNKKLFATLNLSRNEIASFYVKFKEFNGQSFSNLSHLYNTICKKVKISFNNFYAYVLILMELGIVSLNSEEGLHLQIEQNKKTELKFSKIYNTMNFIKQTIRG